MGIAGLIRDKAGAFMRMKVRRELGRFLDAARDCRRTQTEVLQSLVQLNGQSEFARANGLHEVRSPQDLARTLPPTNYNQYADYVERMLKGDQRAMLGEQNKLLMFTLSSGTTNNSKYIPVTTRFLDDYRRGWQIWGIGAFDAYPRLRRLRLLQLSSDYQRFKSEAGTPCGNISGLAAAMQRPVVRTLYTLPYLITKISDPEAKYYTTLRIALADPDVGMITTANPSTLVHLAHLADRRKEELIRDLRNGSLACEADLPPEVAMQLKRHIHKKSRQRAQFIERCVAQHGHLYPKDAWPELQLLAVWLGGSCAAYLPSLKHVFGDLPVRDHGLSASEGRMTLPFEDNCSAGVLDVATHYFEFIPEAEYGSEKPTILMAHELEQGHRYFILLTTASGFFRYDICDVVECVSFEGTTPVLRFMHKGSYISNVTGEKLSESQVVEAVGATLQHFGHRVECFSVAPVWGHPPGYRLLLEDWELPPSQKLAEFETALDERLMSLNCEYREKRDTGRLLPLQVKALRTGSWEKFARERQSRVGGSVEQYKHPCLLHSLELSASVCSRFELDGEAPDHVAAKSAG